MGNLLNYSIHPVMVDHVIWNDGQIAGGGELNYLRAIHAPQNVRLITHFLRQNNPAYAIRVSSICLDKFPVCMPTAASGAAQANRELGDIGIVVRGRENGRSHIRFWILQGKVNRPNWQTMGSSPKEIELYEQCPSFDLFASGQSNTQPMGTFNLSQPDAFGPPPYPAWPFWSFLMFSQNWPSLGEVGTPYQLKDINSPMQLCWDSLGDSSMSFVDGLNNMVLNLQNPAVGFGAPVDTQSLYPEWRRLFGTLWNHSSRTLASECKHGGEAWRNASFMETLIRQPYAYQSAGNTTQSGTSASHIYSTGFQGPDALQIAEKFTEDMVAQNEWSSVPPEEVISGRNGDGGGMSFLVIDLSHID